MPVWRVAAVGAAGCATVRPVADLDAAAGGELVADNVVRALNEVHARLDNREVLHRIDLAVTRIEGEQRASSSRLEATMKTVYGNGVPGLKTDVDRLVQDAVNRKWQTRLLWGVLASAIVGEVILFLNRFIFHVPAQ